MRLGSSSSTRIRFWSLCLTLLVFSAMEWMTCGRAEQTDLIIQNYAQQTDSSAEISTGAEDCTTHEKKRPTNSNFVQAQGTQFTLNGKRFNVNGGNFYWSMTVQATSPSLNAVSTEMQEASSVGVNVGRCWAFADGNYNGALQTSPGVFNEQVFEALDYVIAEAKKYGIYLILSLVNNWNNYGGKQQYVTWAAQQSGCNDDKEEDDNATPNPDTFYTNPTIQTWFKNYMKTMTSRVNTVTGVAYKNEPAIFAWELMNEPECSSDPSGNTLKAWIAEMAPYMKSLDSNHMVEVGTEGYYGPNTPSRANVNPSSYAATVGTDFIMDNQVTGIDFATFHAYPDIWLSQLSESQMLVFMQNWINAHAQDAATTLKMPVLMTEFGKSNQAPNFTEAMRDSFISNAYNSIYASASSGGAAAGCLVWQLLPSVIFANYADEYAFVISQNPSTAAIMQSQSSRMAALH